MKRFITSFLINNTAVIKYLSFLLNIISGIALLMWLFNFEIKIYDWSVDKEALFGVLTTIAVSFNQFHKWLLSEAEYSPAYALALGYVQNFLEPAIIQLIENGIKKPIVYIYKPESISELFKQNIDRTKATIKNMNFELGELQLSLKMSRARDILTIQKSMTEKIYFDFPNTLLSLTAYIDYKTSSGTNESSNREKEKLTATLIEKFYSKMDELLIEKNISPYVKYCDKSLEFNF